MEVDQTYADVARIGIESRFAAVRETIGDERAAYVEWTTEDPANPIGRATFITIVAGSEKKQGAEIQGPQDLHEQATSAIEWSRVQWPDAGAQRLLWRQVPVVEHQSAQRASRRRGLPALPAQTYIYMRLAAVPLAVTLFRPRMR